MIVGTAQYPQYTMCMQVIQSNGDAPYEADEFEMEEMAHKTNPAQSTMFQRPGASLLSAMP